MSGANPQNAALQTQPQSVATGQVLVGFGTTAQRPGNPGNGFLYYDTTIGAEFVWTGTTWARVSPTVSPTIIPVGFGTTAQRPASPVNGYLYFDTTLGAEIVSNNGVWQLVAPVTPPGPVASVTHFTLVTANGGATTRSVYLTAGTWQLSLDTRGYNNDSGGNSNITVTQTGAIVSVGIVTTSFKTLRTGGAGFGRNVEMSGVAVSNVVVPTSGNYVMSMDAAQTSGSTTGNYTSTGSILMCEKLS